MPAARKMRGWLEVLAIITLMPVGSLAGALSGVIILSPILGVLLPLAAATLFLHLEGVTWRTLYQGTGSGFPILAGWTLMTLVITWVAVIISTELLVRFGAPPVDYSFFIQTIEGNLVNYLLFVIPVAWGSAAVGEELLARGFLLHRVEGLAGTGAAVLVQALLFSLAHFYQGVLGMVNIFILAVIFGTVYIRCGRHLLPLILAHGTIDTFSLTLVYLGHTDWLAGA